MKKKIIITTIFFLLILTGTISIVEYYYAKDSSKMPILAIKKEDRAKQFTKYSSVFYNVYKCYSGTIFAVSKTYPEPICERIAVYDGGYYLNRNGLKIDKKDYQMIYDASNTSSEIENFTTEEEVKNAVKISEEYEKNLYKVLRTAQVGNDVVDIVAFKELVLNNYGDYTWEFNMNNYKCKSGNSVKEYKNKRCTGSWKKIGYSKEWCELASKSVNERIKNEYKRYCK